MKILQYTHKEKPRKAGFFAANCGQKQDIFLRDVQKYIKI